MGEREQIITYLLQQCDLKSRIIEELQKKVAELQKSEQELPKGQHESNA